MENISIEVLPSSILSLSSQRGRCRTTRLQDYRIQEYRLTSPPYIKCNVLRESLSEDGQNIPLCNTKEKVVVGNLFISLVEADGGGGHPCTPTHPRSSICALEVPIEHRRLKGLPRLLIYSFFCLAPADWAHEESHPSAATLGFVQNILVHPERSTAVPWRRDSVMRIETILGLIWNGDFWPSSYACYDVFEISCRTGGFYQKTWNETNCSIH